jgi:hypothetical protein
MLKQRERRAPLAPTSCHLVLRASINGFRRKESHFYETVLNMMLVIFQICRIPIFLFYPLVARLARRSSIAPSLGGGRANNLRPGWVVWSLGLRGVGFGVAGTPHNSKSGFRFIAA